MTSSRFRRVPADNMVVINDLIAEGTIGVPDYSFTNSLFTEIDFASDGDLEKVNALVYMALLRPYLEEP